MDRVVKEKTQLAENSPSGTSSVGPGLAEYPLLDAMLNRRSRRFGMGMRLNGGPLAYQSSHPPQPLTFEEEAALAFAACGITGFVYADLPYDSGDEHEAGGGNIMTHTFGRTVPSGDAMHTISLFVINDEGTWRLKRPQDYPRAELPELIAAARAHDWSALYERSCQRIADHRLDVPRELPYVPPFNKWSANVPGTTYFLPVAELSAVFIDLALTALSEEVGYYIVDERNNFRPAGLARFARSRGGHLHDRVEDDRVAPLGYLDDWLYEFSAIEQGAMLQNLGLMAEALGLGGFVHFAAHAYIWPQVLGFRMSDVPFSSSIGAGPLKRSALRLLGKDLPLPTAVGLERAGEVLLKAFCPPYYRNMEEAVLAFIDYKFAPGSGTLRDGGAASAWCDGAVVQAGIPPYSDQTIAATIACCDYVYRRYGRLPGSTGPFRTVLAYQAHRLDPDFYQRFYRTFDE